MNEFKIRCVVACHNSEGQPDFFGCAVTVSPDEYEDGVHYEEAEAACSQAAYESPFVVFDENDGPAWLFEKVFGG